jgi:Ca2+-binding EF-hand superfamily protein
LNRYFDHYDKDGDDHLTLDEIQQFLIEIGKVKVEGKGKAESKHSTSDLARIIMDKLDKDGDGTISRN